MTHPQFVPPGSEASTAPAPVSTSDISATGGAHAILEQAQAVLDEAHADLDSARTGLAEAGADLGEAQAELEEAEEELAVVTEVAEEGYNDYDDFLDDDEEAGQLRPGDLDEPFIAVWDPELAERYREAFRAVQAHFVDEPEAALSEAQDLVAEAVQALADALLAEQVSLDPHEQDPNPDTETMRIAMRGYRDFLDRVLAL